MRLAMGSHRQGFASELIAASKVSWHDEIEPAALARRAEKNDFLVPGGLLVKKFQMLDRNIRRPVKSAASCSLPPLTLTTQTSMT